MKKLILFYFCLLICVKAYGQEAGFGRAAQLFYQANAAYKSGNYAGAIADYRKIGYLGLESGNIYYNLGNSYFKNAQPGKAVFYYEKALFFIPLDSDLRANYEFVLSSLGLTRAYFGNWFQKFCSRTFSGMTIDALVVSVSIIYILGLMLPAAALYLSVFKSISRAALPILCVILIAALTALADRISYLERGAIVTAPSAEAKFEPSDSATTYFKLPQGSRVEIIDRSANWLKIKRPDNLIGWVDRSFLDTFLADMPVGAGKAVTK